MTKLATNYLTREGNDGVSYTIAARQRCSGLTRLEDDGNVGGVEELDGVGRVLATVASGLDREVDAESLRKGNFIINQVQLGSIRR